MSGNIPELNDPGNAFNRANTYPSAFFATDTSETIGAEPSIRGRQIYIPINAWFTLDSRCAFPLVSLQYNELEIYVTLRPIQELFQVRDVFDYENDFLIFNLILIKLVFKCIVFYKVLLPQILLLIIIITRIS